MSYSTATRPENEASQYAAGLSEQPINYDHKQEAVGILESTLISDACKSLQHRFLINLWNGHQIHSVHNSEITVVQFVYMVDYIDGFSYVEPSLHSWDEAYLVMLDDFSDVFLDWIHQDFVEYFCIKFLE
ncbi:hypothetical protein H671_2g6621, partial [Cricetulus griseus]